MLERRDVGHRRRQRVGALDQVAPRPPEAERPRRGVTEHLELERRVAELVRQAERFPHVEPRPAPAAPRQVADPREQGVDRDAPTRVVRGQRHRLAKERLGELEVREIQRHERASGQDVGPKRPVRAARRRRRAGSRPPDACRRTRSGARRRPSAGGGVRRPRPTGVSRAASSASSAATSDAPRRAAASAPCSRARATDCVRADRRPRQVPGALLGLGDDLGEPLVDAPAPIGRGAAVRGRGEERMGEADGVAGDLEHAGGDGALQPAAARSGPERGDEDRHRRLRERGGVQRDLVGRRIQGGDAGADQAIEAARHLERVRASPTSRGAGAHAPARSRRTAFRRRSRGAGRGRDATGSGPDAGAGGRRSRRSRAGRRRAGVSRSGGSAASQRGSGSSAAAARRASRNPTRSSSRRRTANSSARTEASSSHGTSSIATSSGRVGGRGSQDVERGEGDAERMRRRRPRHAEQRGVEGVALRLRQVRHGRLEERPEQVAERGEGEARLDLGRPRRDDPVPTLRGASIPADQSVVLPMPAWPDSSSSREPPPATASRNRSISSSSA